MSGPASYDVLVLAKAPVAGRVKTRLGASLGPETGMDAAAEVAASALLDTLAAAGAAAPGRTHLALDGDLHDAVRGPELVDATSGWWIRPQSDGELGERIAAAFAPLPGPAVQVGMDTPQLEAALLREVAAGLEQHDAVLGEAEDGGWWVLALRDPSAAAALRGVPMSTPTTYADTRAALVAAGLDVGTTTVLRDVDTVEDAEAVAAAAPDTRFARAWKELAR